MELRKKDILISAQSRQAAMGEMIGFIAHQWKQPLNAIGVIVQNLEDSYNYGELTDDSLKNCTETVMQQIKYMSETINDFRNFFVPQQEKSLFQISDIIRQTLRFVDLSFKRNDIDLTLNIDSNCAINGRSNELAQVLLNILNNARDAFLERDIPPSERQVKITHSRLDDTCQIYINDTAGGISDNLMENIFDPYFTTKSSSNGTGLGLFISKRIVEEHFHGKLSARNTGNGVEFLIELNCE
ncbi:MAG: HAMP domain-containing histidine kinase [Candidatus Cloacimonetes bacterium]|nr:HAMP domain-containing histidine kinase [Candidatus Cloacimonadota bacterium]